MEIDITHFVRTAETHELSGSVAELGQDAGKITWNNAVREAATTQLISQDDRDEFERWVREFGAWDRAEYERADDMPRHFHIISELQHYDMLDKDTVDVGTRGVDTMEEFMAMLSSEPSVVEAAFAGTPFICAHCTSLVFEKGLCYDHLQESQ